MKSTSSTSSPKIQSSSNLMGLYTELSKGDNDLSTYSKKTLVSINHHGQTLLHYAARLGDNALLIKLLETGYFETNSTDIKGYTAADYAIKENQNTTLLTLVKNGATISNYVIKYNAGKQSLENKAMAFKDATIKACDFYSDFYSSYTSSTPSVEEFNPMCFHYQLDKYLIDYSDSDSDSDSDFFMACVEEAPLMARVKEAPLMARVEEINPMRFQHLLDKYPIHPEFESDSDWSDSDWSDFGSSYTPSTPSVEETPWIPNVQKINLAPFHRLLDKCLTDHVDYWKIIAEHIDKTICSGPGVTGIILDYINYNNYYEGDAIPSTIDML